MEQSTCPVTSTVSSGVGSPKPPLLSCENANSPKVERESPEPNCAICLGKTENKSFTDSCLHQFCFNCLLEWSKVKAECPLCKQSFKSIIHNVRSNEEYEEYYVEASRENRHWQEDTGVVRFRYSTTLTPERQRERFLESIVRPLFFGTDAIPARRVNNRRRYRNSTADFRASIYRENLWVNPLPDVTGRYRESSPDFYRMNPAQLHRLVPWLNRELNVLKVPSSHLMMVVDLILNLLTQHCITSNEFKTRLTPHIGVHTQHFIHEFYAFARSPYDMVGFDQSADYRHRQTTYAAEVQAIDSDNDSDVILLSPNNNDNASSSSSAPISAQAQPSTSGSVNFVHTPTYNDIQPLNLSAGSSHPLPRLSPIAGPSDLDPDLILMITRELQNSVYRDLPMNTVNVTAPQLAQNNEAESQTVESDSDDCVFVGSVKPRHERTPEVITLASDVESNAEQEVQENDSVEERLKDSLSSSSSSSSYDSRTSDEDYVPHQTRHPKKVTPKWKKNRRRDRSSSEDTGSADRRRSRVYSSDSDAFVENRRVKKFKSKGKHKKAVESSHDSSDENKQERNSNKMRKSRKEVWRIVRKQEPETDHDYSIDRYDPPYTEDEWASLSTDRPKLRSIVISKSAGSSKRREPSYSSASIASSSRSSSHYHESKRHRHKTSHKRDTKRRKGHHYSESSSSVRFSKGKKSKNKRSHRNAESSS